VTQEAKRRKQDRDQEKNRKAITRWAIGGTILIAIAVVYVLFLRPQSINDALLDYMGELENDEKIQSKAFSVGFAQYRTEIGDEVALEDRELLDDLLVAWPNAWSILELAFSAEDVTFSREGGISWPGITLNFTPPTQIIFLIDREEHERFKLMEISLATPGLKPSDPEAITTISLINWGAGNLLDGDFDLFYKSRAILQAICLGYAGPYNEGSDAGCNVIAANAAAGWSGMSEEQTEVLMRLEGYTTTSDGDQNTETMYRYIPAVWEAFAVESREE
jgi:hypothetical protein